MSYKSVEGTMTRSTMIGNKPNEIKTIEHLMAALYICQIANAEINIDNAEVPIMDGGIVEFIRILRTLKQPEKISILRVKKEITACQSELYVPLWLRIYNFMKGNKKKGAFVRLLPSTSNTLEVIAEIDFTASVIGFQKYSFVFDYDTFAKSAARFMKEIAPSRTFGSEADLLFLKKHGMGQGANSANVIAINKAGTDTLNNLYYSNPVARDRMLSKYKDMFVSPPVRLYYPDEFVRHKIIDAIGDLYASGASIVGKFVSVRGGHALNNLVLHKLFSDPSNYDIIAA